MAMGHYPGGRAPAEESPSDGLSTRRGAQGASRSGHKRSPEGGVSFQERGRPEPLGSWAVHFPDLGVLPWVYHSLVPVAPPTGDLRQRRGPGRSTTGRGGLIGQSGSAIWLDRCFAPSVAVCFFLRLCARAVSYCGVVWREVWC